jgi:hypothetical protein
MFSLCFVVGASWSSMKYMKACAKHILFQTSARRGEVLRFDHVDVVLGYLETEA